MRVPEAAAFPETSGQLVGSRVVKRTTQRAPEIEVGIKKLSWGCEGQRQGKQKEQIGWSCGWSRSQLRAPVTSPQMSDFIPQSSSVAYSMEKCNTLM